MRARDNSHESYDPYRPEHYSEDIPPHEPDTSNTRDHRRPDIKKFLEGNGAPRPGTCWGPDVLLGYGSDAGNDDPIDWSLAFKNTFPQDSQPHRPRAPPAAPRARASPVIGGELQQMLDKFHEGKIAEEESKRQLRGVIQPPPRSIQRAYSEDQANNDQVQLPYWNGGDRFQSQEGAFSDGHQSSGSMGRLYKGGPLNKSSQTSNTATDRLIVYGQRY